VGYRRTRGRRALHDTLGVATNGIVAACGHRKQHEDRARPHRVSFQEPANVRSDIVTPSAERREPLVGGTLRLRGIRKGPRQSLNDAREDWALLNYGVAHGDCVGDWATEKRPHGLGLLVRDVDTQFRHDIDGERMNDGAGVCPRAKGFEAIAAEGAQKSFGHLAATRVFVADKQNLSLHSGPPFLPPNNNTLIVVAKPASTTLVSDAVETPVSASKMRDTTAPAICGVPRTNRTASTGGVADLHGRVSDSLTAIRLSE
jgi:hypothetical protein